MRFAVSGSSGLVGRALCRQLASEGDGLIRIVRRATGSGEEAVWDTSSDTLETDELEGIDALVHLAGENIVGRWTRSKRERILSSRVKGTRAMCQAMSKMRDPPKVFLCASAVGYYGDTGDRIVTEEQPSGDCFLSEVARAWESGAKEAAASGVRVVSLRIGVVLGLEGGALQKLLLPFKLGLGGRIGGGQQYMSWISVGDMARTILFAARTPALSGPVNCTAPHPVTNAEFARTLGKLLQRPTILPLPGWLLKLALGQMGRETLLSGTRVFPTRLERAGFRFDHEHLEDALRAILARPG